MAAYDDDAAGGEYGDNTIWPYGGIPLVIQGGPDLSLAVARFTGLSDVLSTGDIADATLEIDWSGDTAVTTVKVWGVKLEDLSLPGSWSSAYSWYQDYRTVAEPSFPSSGVSSYSLDVETLMAEMAGAIDGDSLLLLFAIDGGGDPLTGVTCSLHINYGELGDTDPGTSDNPSAAWLMFMDT